MHYLFYGDVDPFGQGWPLILQASALVSAFIITLLLHCPITSALGVYVGLVGLMLVSGASEYPMSSSVGFAVHGYLPAAFGAALAIGVRYGTCWKIPPASASN